MRREIIEAGAGCGKTTRLVARYLEALKAYSPSQVVAVTFTKEAAHQMLARVNTALIKEGKPGLAKQVKQEAQISTFHSLCYRLLQPHLNSQGYNERLYSSHEVRFLRKDAILRTLAQREDLTKQISEIFGVMPLNVFLDFCNDNWFSNSPKSSTHSSDFSSARKFEATHKDLLVNYSHFLKDLENQYKAAKQAFMDPALHVAWFEALGRFLESPYNADFDPKQFSFTKAQKIKNAFPNLALASYQIKASLEDEILDDLDEKFVHDESQLNNLLQELKSEIKKSLSHQKHLDFEALEQEAMKLIDSCPLDARRSLLGPAPRVLLVDEFQDTNRTQFKILTALSDEKTEWFFVGDPKQSIYFFRGADVSLFLECQKTMQNQSLSTNYRTDPILLDFFNIVCEETFTLAKRFSASPEVFIFDPPVQKLASPEGATNTHANPIRVFEFESPTKGFAPSNQKLYPFVIQRIEENLKKGKSDSTHAVLFQSWTELYRFSEVLRQKNIHHSISGAENILDHELSDLFVDYLKWLVSPDHPFSNKTLIRWTTDGFESPNETFDSHFDQLQRGQIVDNGCLSQEILAAFCLDFTPERFPGGDDWIAAMEVFLSSWDLAMPPHLYSLQERIRMLMSTPFKLESSEGIWGRTQSTERLSLLTVHGSKGLEFDYVYLPQLAKTGRSGSGSTVVGESEAPESEEELTLSGFQIFNSKKNRYSNGLVYFSEKQKMRTKIEAERRRLFYVALTRAKSCIEFYFFKPSKSLLEKFDLENKNNSGAILGLPAAFATPWNLILDHLKNEGKFHGFFQTGALTWEQLQLPEANPNKLTAPDLKLDTPPDPQILIPKATIPKISDLMDSGSKFEIAFSRSSVSRYLKSHDEVNSRPGSKSGAPDLNTTELGTELHHVLEIFRKPFSWDLIESPQKPLLKKAIDSLLELPALKNFWLSVETNPSSVVREWPLEITLPKFHLTGIIDALWQKSPEEIWILDWKSGRKLQNLKDPMRIQRIQDQLSLYARALGRNETKNLRIKMVAVGVGWEPEPQAEILFEKFYE